MKDMNIKLKIVVPMFAFALLGCKGEQIAPEKDDVPTELLEKLKRLSEEELNDLLDAAQKERDGQIRSVQRHDPLLRKLSIK